MSDADEYVTMTVDQLLGQVLELRARINAYEGHLEAWEEIDRLIADSSLGTPEAAERRAQMPRGLARALVRAMQEKDRCDNALDALELMVEQYLFGPVIDAYDHQFMAAGEEACAVLAKLRPEKWELTRIGVRRRG